MPSLQSLPDVRIGGGRSIFLLLASSAAFSVFGVALIARPDASVMSKVFGGLTIALFGSGLFIGVRMLRAGGMYILTADGIRFPFHKWPLLPWSEVQGTKIVTRLGRRYLAVDVRGADAKLRHMRSGARGARRNLRTGFGLVTIPEQMSPTSLEELQRTIERFRAAGPTATTPTAFVDEGATILPASAASARAGGFYAAPGSARALRNVALANALLLLLAMLRRHTSSTPRALLLAVAVALLIGASALQLHRILAGSVTIVAAAIFLVAIDLTAGHHVAVATRVGYLFFPFCLLFVALASWPRYRRSP